MCGPGEPLALDGKTLRGVHGAGLPGVHLIGAHAHQARRFWRRCAALAREEVAAVKRLLPQRDVSARIVTGGGAYVLPMDGNQPSLREGIALAFSLLARSES